MKKKKVNHENKQTKDKKKKNLHANAGDVGLIPGSGKPPISFLCWFAVDRGAWWARAHGVAKSGT